MHMPFLIFAVPEDSMDIDGNDDETVEIGDGTPSDGCETDDGAQVRIPITHLFEHLMNWTCIGVST
jgi:hypothetical protein